VRKFVCVIFTEKKKYFSGTAYLMVLRAEEASKSFNKIILN
jgi:hypothetical protein